MKPLLVGTTKRGRSVLMPSDVRATHMHVIGATGTGKTKFLEHLIRQDILANNGLCLIDPTGNLYYDLVCWCETKGFLGRKKIVLFEPSSDEWSFGFNPLDFGPASDQDLSFCVDAMVKAGAAVWGGEDTDKTPLLKRCLRVTFHVLAEHRLTLLEALELVQSGDSPLRRYLATTVQDEVIRWQWAEFLKLRPREFEERFGSTINRLMEFLASERIRRILGQQERIIDFRRLMDEGSIFLVNLSSGEKVSEDNVSLLGALMVNDLFLKARKRPKGSRPFYVYIDECHRFVNQDIAGILDMGRQFGLHLILAHQHLAQLKDAGEAVYGAVMTNARTKAVFGGMHPDDARVMADTVFMEEINLEEEKRILRRPVVVGYETVWLESEGFSHGTSTAAGWTEGSSASAGTSDSVSSSVEEEWFFGPDETPSTVRSQGTSRSESSSSGRSGSETVSEGYSSGRAQAMRPILEDRAGGTYSLEEQLHRAAAKLRGLPKQHAVVKMLQSASVAIETPTVRPGYAGPERVTRFKRETFRRSLFASAIEEADQERELRCLRLKEEALLHAATLLPAEPSRAEDFLE